MELVIGLLGAVICIGSFVGGVLFGRTLSKPSVSIITDEEKKAIQLERERLIDEQNAFKDLMNYNADIAYNIGNGTQG